MVMYKVPTTVIVQEVLEELVLLDSEHGGYFELNATAAQIFRGLEKGRDRHEILAELAHAYQVDAAALSRDFEALVSDLLEYGLLTSG